MNKVLKLKRCRRDAAIIASSFDDFLRALF